MRDSSSTSNTDDRHPSADREINPFVLFRHFADNQLAAALKSLDEIRGWRRTGERPCRTASRPDASDAEWDGADQRRNESDQPSIPWFGRAGYGEGGDGIPHGQEGPRHPSQSDSVMMPPWSGRSEAEDECCVSPLGFLLFDSYSPVNLELTDNQRGLPNWRDAFEDLLLVARGKEMPPRRESERKHRLEYILGLMQKAYPHLCGAEEGDARGVSLPVLLGRGFPLHALLHEDEDEGEDKGPATELDLFGRLLAAQDGVAQSSSSSSSILSTAMSMAMSNAADDASASRGPQRPSIISTLTTTERTTASDGTVHTKVVLKRRFADGREESRETTHTSSSHGGRGDLATTKTDLRQPNGGGPAEDRKTSTNEKGKGGRGWFWTG